MEFQVSAPGKVILFGEHAVVYNKTAVAASLDLRTTLKFTELPNHDNINLLMPKLDLNIEIPLKRIIEYFKVEKCPKYRENHQNFYKYVSEFVSGLNYSGVNQKLGLEALVYLLIAVLQSESFDLKPFELFLDTGLSIGSGLGSSASFAVCISTCFIHWSNLQKGLTTDLNKNELDKVSEYAMNCEKIMHGTPSGIDHTVAIYGSVIEFKKDEKLELKPILGVKPMEILLVDTQVPRSTKKLVEKFAELKNKFPKIYDPILESIDNVSKEALAVIRKISELDDQESVDAYQQLMTFMEINHGLLTSCQVSHPSLEKICAEAKKFNLSAKMTGAGGGGYGYILLPPYISNQVVDQLSSQLIADGFLVTRTNLGGVGVRIDKK
ncbi:uncharacterized protein LOC130678217 [Microplitis mediator]|uniref:uncharacterized protein LOC130678217 n=1 Tax=Microplitis mediator TaxID=375433 RepID=UPI0025561DBB|nr:uncharacterized protein LOC130678217 [Microplitis mediator]